MNRSATAVWKGELKSGGGTLTDGHGALKGASYTFESRFEDKPGLTPEDLIAAAHAACFAMALSADLGRAGLKPERIEATAQVTLDKVDGKPTITRSHLTCTARVPGADRAKFMEIAEGTRAGCPVSRLFKAEITLDAKLEDQGAHV